MPEQKYVSIYLQFKKIDGINNFLSNFFRIFFYFKKVIHFRKLGHRVIAQQNIFSFLVKRYNLQKHI